MKTIKYMPLFCCLLIFFLTRCGSNDKSSDSTIKKFVGKWKAQKETLITLTDTVEKPYEMQLAIKDDGSFVSQDAQKSRKGTFQINKKTITFRFEEGDEIAFEYEFNNDLLRFSRKGHNNNLHIYVLEKKCI